MLTNAIIIAFSIHMILAATASTIPMAKRFLPLGGTSTARVGAIVLFCVGIAQLRQVLG